MFQILIEEFEEAMGRRLSTEKKKEILKIFATYNKLRSKNELDEIKYQIYIAYIKGDLECIKILLGETIKKPSGLTFKINKIDKTASLFGVHSDIKELFIPRTVEHGSTQYLITSIYYTSNNIKTIKFSEDSAVKTFYRNAFSESELKEIYFPESLKELKEGWCLETNKLKKIIISPSNGQFKFIDDKYLLGKSDPNNDEFDTLLFVRRDIKEFSIPSNIKIISSCAFNNCINIKSIFIPSKVSKICEHAFSYCTNLIKVEIPTNSNLQTIEPHAFSFSNIESIFIPSKVTKICESAFYDCQNLTKVEIPTNSNLQTIESRAFSNSKIEEIYFPASLKKLEEGWCNGTGKLKKIIISPSNGQFKFIDDKYLLGKSDSNNDEFNVILFVHLDIKEFSIPSNIKIISSYAFNGCHNLTKVEIPTNSNLQIIKPHAFSFSNIESIFIPSKVTKICESAFYDCQNLTKVEIPTNSNLQTIESEAFSFSKIESIFIPSKVSTICEHAFYGTSLQIIEISEESELVSPLSSVFQEYQSCIIMIPSSLYIF